MAGVAYEGVTKKFGDVVALNNLNLTINDGEFMVLVGPSGCGKTTALRCLAGLEEVTEGSVMIDGAVVNDVPPKDRDIAMVFQSYALYPHMTVFDNMAFGLKLRKVPKDQIKRRVQDAAGILGLENLLDRKPRELSGGQRQRVAVGRAIVREPKVFLLDEPLSNLDAKLRVQTRAELTKLHLRLGTTFVYVTHDQVEAMTMASRIAVMNKGVLQQLDSPQNLYDKPANLFVAGFIGSPSMNFFPAKLRRSEDKIYVDADDFSLQIPDDKKATYAPYADHDVIFGIRPEDIYNPQFAPPGVNAQPVNSKVDVVELMGYEVNLYMVTPHHSFVARVDPRTRTSIGQEMQLLFDMEHFHVFDPSVDAENPVAIR